MGKTPRPPRGLGPAGKELWNQLQAEYDIVDAGGRRLLQIAAECRDLESQAMAMVRKEGFTTIDRYQQRRPHPMLAAARDARGQMLTALKGLNLSVEVIRDRPGRSPGR